VPIHAFREHLTQFSNVKSIIPRTLKLVHQVGAFTVSKVGDVDGACFAVGLVARKGFFRDSKGMKAEVSVSEDLAEVGGQRQS
jgi:hypothetical protein